MLRQLFLKPVWATAVRREPQDAAGQSTPGFDFGGASCGDAGKAPASVHHGQVENIKGQTEMPQAWLTQYTREGWEVGQFQLIHTMQLYSAYKFCMRTSIKGDEG